MGAALVDMHGPSTFLLGRNPVVSADFVLEGVSPDTASQQHAGGESQVLKDLHGVRPTEQSPHALRSPPGRGGCSRFRSADPGIIADAANL